jgi:MazG family protein
MPDKPTLDDALALMRDLRKRCDWDRVQTHESLRPYLIEEAHELDDALRRGNRADTREELGDVLLQVLFHSVIAEEQGEFDASDVAESLVTKMRERHPHLYGGGEKRDWEEMKASKRESIADGLPAALPTLHRAYRLQERAAGVGFDWDDTEGPAKKVEEELAEVRGELAERGKASPARAARAQAHLEDEIGDLLFAVINLSRRAGVHPALALDRATDKFARRFEAVEALARARGIVVGDAGIETLDALWNEVKLAE